MAVPVNICIAWPSTVGSIPAGWTREVALDARYIKGSAAGADADLTTDRGNTTHTHTSPSHTPIQDAHTHAVYTLGSDNDQQVVGGGGGGGTASADGHGHNSTASSSTVGTNNGIAITVDATSNDLSYVEVIWIKSDGTPLTFPAGCLAFFASDSLPSGWTRVHGDRYLKGATVGGGGGATGGSNTHVHTSPAHTHTQNQHTHTATSLGGNLGFFRGPSPTDTVASTGHTHVLDLIGDAGTNQSVTTTINSGNHEPPFSKLNIITPGSASLPTNVIALWLGTHAGIPAEWSRYTAMDGKWLKGCAADGQVGTTGGASQHNHTASSCQPVQNSHTHSVSDPGSTATALINGAGSNFFAGNGHVHSSWTVDAATPTNQSVAVTIDNCTADAALPKHRTVIFVQFTGTGPVGRPATYTSYDLDLFVPEDPYSRLLPEAEYRIAHGDLRHLPRV